MGAKWTKREDQIILAMHKKGFMPKDIGRVLKSRPTESIKDRLYVLGGKWSQEPEIDEKLFKEMMGK